MPLSRRDFLKNAGLAIGGFGLAAGGFDRIIPYVIQPEDIVPGVAAWYATSCRECPAGCAMLIRNRESHVVKCEGNPTHPVNLGKLCPRGQAALMGLYDPDRVPTAQQRDTSGQFQDVGWDDAYKKIANALTGKKRIVILSDLQTGTLKALMGSWLVAFGSNRLIIWEPIDYSPVKSAFGVVPGFDIATCDFLVSFGADFLENWISPVEYARGFAEMRRLRDGARSEFVYIGPRVSATATNADLRITIPPGAETEVAHGIASGNAKAVSAKYHIDPNDIARVSAALKSARNPLILPGWYSASDEAVRVLGGDKSKAIDRTRPHAVTEISGISEIAALIRDMEAGLVDALFVLGTNPVYSLPESARFAEAIKRVPVKVSLSSYMDETAALADWILPSNTPLESWGDYQPYPDVINLMQPTMGQIFDTRQAGDTLIGLAKAAGFNLGAQTFYEYLRNRWGFPVKAGETPDTPAPEWEALLQKGYTQGASAAVSAPKAAVASPPQPQQPSSIRLYAFPQTYYYDGRGANRRWLQELPEPVTKTVWGTWAEIHPDTAAKLNIKTNDQIEIKTDKAKIVTSAFVWEGVARNTVAVPIGEGHTKYGRFASGVGANVLPLLTTPSPGVQVNKTGQKQHVNRILGSTDQSGRNIVQTQPIKKPFKRDREIIMPLPSGYTHWDFYPGQKYEQHRWAMVVDLDKCIGCHACVAACYAENNIGIVGAEEISRRREMSWIRIDRYIDWQEPAAPILFQPMLCQHCDAAPCEPVCPVFAASHSDEGLNMQIYNRCVGTRYCSNNCPYKVRRFNWYDYQWPQPLNWQLNPDVTVRCRGVMEKCTFCIQRIREVEIVAQREGRKIEDGEIVPACVQTCPTGVFTFGDLMDKDSKVSRMFADEPRAYQVLAELNTKPAIIYLKRVTS